MASTVEFDSRFIAKLAAAEARMPRTSMTSIFSFVAICSTFFLVVITFDLSTSCACAKPIEQAIAENNTDFLNNVDKGKETGVFNLLAFM